MRDDLGTEVVRQGPARRVVSLVPSLTEAIASANRDGLVGATDWCSHPGNLDVTRVRGTKNPDVTAIVALQPDLVIANREENRELDVRRMREAGLQVWVTVIETVPQAIESMERMFAEALGWDAPGWLAEVRGLWAGPAPKPRARVAVPIWRDPWMVIGGRTFTGDLLERLGYENAFGHDKARYPKVDLSHLDTAAIDLVLLPDEPYEFTTDDGPEMFRRTPTKLVSGRMLTWYGPSLVAARGLDLT